MSDDTSIAAPESGVEAESTAQPEAPVNMTGAEELDVKLDALSKEIAAQNTAKPDEPQNEEALESDDTAETAEDDEDALLEEILSEDESDSPAKLEIDFGGTKFEYKEGEMSPELAERVQETIKGFEGAQTRKSQELAEQRKAVEEAKASVDRISNLDGQALKLFTDGQLLKQSIEKIESLNMNALWQSRPDEARQLSDRLALEKSQLAQVVNEVDRLETESLEARNADVGRRMAEGEKEVLKLDPDFMKTEPAIIEYVTKNFGLSEDEAKTWRLNPTTAIMAKKAYLYDQMKDRISAKKSAKIPKPTPSKPVKGKGTSTKTDFGRMSVAERKKYLGLPG